MKDTVVTGKRKKTELLVALACLIAACLINVGSIVYYDTDWREAITEFGFVVCVAVVLYVLTVLARLLVCAVVRMIGDRRC